MQVLHLVVGLVCCTHMSMGEYTTHKMDTQQLTNKTLVVVVGNCRGGEDAWESLYAHVLDTNYADLAMMIGNTSERRSSLFSRSRFIWFAKEFPHNKWDGALDEIERVASIPPQELSWQDVAMTSKYSAFGGTMVDPNGNGVITPYQKWLLAHALHESSLMRHYERIIVTRTDQYYLCDLHLHDMGLGDHAWVPRGQDWGGLCDRFMVMPKHRTWTILTAIEHPLRHLHMYTSYPFQKNPETLLKYGLEHRGVPVRRFPRNMFTVKREKDLSNTKIRGGRQGVPGLPTLIIKKINEYRMARRTCHEMVRR